MLIMSVFHFMDNRQNDSNLILREKSNGHKSNPVEVKENGLVNFQTFGFFFTGVLTYRDIPCVRSA